MRQTKRLLAMMLTLLMIVGLLPIGTLAATYRVGQENVEISQWIPLEIAGRYKPYTGDIVYGDGYMIASSDGGCVMDKDAKRVYVTLNEEGSIPCYYNNKGELKFGSDKKPAEHEWTFTSDGKILYENKYLRKDGNNTTFKVDNNTTYSDWTFENKGNGLYELSMTISGTTYYMTYSGSGDKFSLTTTPTSVYLYEYVPYYVGLSGAMNHTVYTNSYANQAALEAYLRNCVKLYSADDTNGANIEQVEYTLSGTVDPTVAGSGSLNVVYQGQTIGTINLTFLDRVLQDVGLTAPAIGVSYVGVTKPSTFTQSYLTEFYDNGTTEQVPITLGMISDGYVNYYSEGVYENLTVTYGDYTEDGYTLRIIPNPNQNDYPEYPTGGSVTVNKHGTGVDFSSSGVAEIELSAKGIPTKGAADVVVMIDTSSTMTDVVEGSLQRIDILKNSLAHLVEAFAEPGEDGLIPDIRMTIADFNGYSDEGTLPIEDMEEVSRTFLNYGDSRGKIEPAGSWNEAQVYTGSKEIDADSLVPISELSVDFQSVLDDISCAYGTNYDYAFDTVYRLVSAIQEDNKACAVERDLYVIFMSDGEPYEYNYYLGNYDSDNWWDFLYGELDADGIANLGQYAHFYVGDGTRGSGKHRMVEAIKGDPNAMYEVISPTGDLPGAVAIPEKSYMYDVPGLGATMFSIAYCYNNAMQDIIGPIASDPDYYYEVSDNAGSQDEMTGVFMDIKDNIYRLAGTNARFIDTMGEDYDIQLANSTYDVVVDGEVVTETITPSISVKAYDVHKRAEFLAGEIEENQIGTRTGTVDILETVTFNADGTEAYSDRKTEDGNILINGVICAENFYYNTTSADVVVGDITIAPETFYWIIGDIDEKEYTLNYYVYLTGSREGTRPAGRYPTNESAVLHYTNWLDHEAHKDTVSPIMPWGAATVSYAFYLVDENGNMVNSQGAPITSFANRTILTQPAVYSTLYLNSSEDLAARLVAKDVAPYGLELYDVDAEFEITITSSTANSGWVITQGTEKATTYVTGYNGTEYTNETIGDSLSYDYTNTIVWFAVKTQIKCIPDVVVVDFGLPVDIDVLANDMFSGFGTLTGILPASCVGDLEGGSSGRHVEPVVHPELTPQFGVAGIENGMVTYTPTTMGMYDVETFVYEVQYTNPSAGALGINGFYYGTVTVVPATLIYYEDRNDAADFVDFEGDWSDVDTNGNRNKGQLKKQAQDRPGFYSFSSVDANNIYGYDPAYGDCTEFSLDAAKKVTVSNKDKDNWPTATFTFTGTGFDLISVTSKDTGSIKIDVYKTGEISVGSDGKPVVTDCSKVAVENWVVDTYYGYKPTVTDGYIRSLWTYKDGLWHILRQKVDEPGVNTEFPKHPQENDTVTVYDVNYKWEVTTSADENALYQIPVIKCYDTLDYARYEVVVTPIYSGLFQHNKAKESYDFYFDAVRIYNPADMSAEAIEYYKQDNEAYPQYIEIRENLISQDSFGSVSLSDNEPITGAVFIDGFDAETGIDVFRYTEFGPNNEVYLMTNQAIAFRVTTPDKDKLASVQIGAKAVNGTAKLNISSYGAGMKDGVSYDMTKLAGKSIDINTATDMFYNATDCVTWDSATESNIIVLKNTGERILSLTQMKFTFKEDPNAEPVDYIDSDPGDDPLTMMSMAPRFAMLLVSTLRDEFIAENTEEVPYEEPVEEEPVEEEPVEEISAETYAPEKFELSLKKNSVKAGQKVDVTVETSGDVEEVTINGEAAELFKTNKKTGEKTWTLRFTAETSGTMVISAVACSADGLTSEPVEAFVNVR